MQLFTVIDWEIWRQAGYTRLPAVAVHRETNLPRSWDHLTGKAASVLLESAQAGRYSYVCGTADRIVIGQAGAAEIWSGDCSRIMETRAGPPLAVLASLLEATKAPKLPGWPAMTGGFIGVCGYDMVRSWERLPVLANRDLAIPLYAMLEPRELYVYDHLESTLGIVIWCDLKGDGAINEVFQRGVHAADRAWQRWQYADAPEERKPTRNGGSAGNEADQPPVPSLNAAQFQSAVIQAQEYIAAGDTYQVNLSLRTSRSVHVSPGEMYEALRQVNPSPYMGLLWLSDFALVCGSPELLVRLVDGVISSRPIAGTRPRGEALAEDVKLSAELLANEKERAEHLMLVDLIRNDIGRVAEFGTVCVSEFMAIEQYSHVMHIVSQVEGRLAAGRTWADVFKSMFPGGTITGCPKIRTMQIIEELEPVGRGFYTGALGWISYAGEMEMNIVIRSMLIQQGVAHVQAGAGIVADSKPARELDEALRKAQALWVALDEATKAKDHE